MKGRLGTKIFVTVNSHFNSFQVFTEKPKGHYSRNWSNLVFFRMFFVFHRFIVIFRLGIFWWLILYNFSPGCRFSRKIILYWHSAFAWIVPFSLKRKKNSVKWEICAELNIFFHVAAESSVLIHVHPFDKLKTEYNKSEFWSSFFVITVQINHILKMDVKLKKISNATRQNFIWILFCVRCMTINY